jgi:hypothetical protein
MTMGSGFAPKRQWCRCVGTVKFEGGTKTESALQPTKIVNRNPGLDSLQHPPEQSVPTS